jgi:DNA-directed RNA polymerase specialized sigma24 family protein
LPKDAEKAAGYDVEQPLDTIEKNLEPPAVRTESLIPDSTAMPPDEFVAQKDALAKLEQDMRNWPRPEREVFELYYVECLEPQEISMVTGQALARCSNTSPRFMPGCAKKFSEAKEANDEDNRRLKSRKRPKSQHRRVLASVPKVLYNRHGIFFDFIK